MSERDVIAAARQIADPAERCAYLDRACADDVALRQRVEVLLGDNVGEPVEADVVSSEDVTAAIDTMGLSGPGGGEGNPLDFLQPPAMPGSLGRLGHYEVLEILGWGGFGIVLRAFDEVLRRVVAVKVMAPQIAASSPARKRFLREARASAPIRHENVVLVHAIEELPLPHLVMEFIPGQTLQQLLDGSGPLDVIEVLRIGAQLARGLAAAHAVGLIHRDVKPANVLLEGGRERRAKLTDFGLARAADDASLSQSGLIVGTPLYMAPEQSRGEALDHRADLFSLGSVLYEMCCGRPPFRAPTTLAVLKRVAEDEPRAIREIIPEVPQWLCAIVAKLHAKDPAARYQTGAEVAEALEGCLRRVAAGEAVPAPAGPPRRRVRGAALAVAMAAIVFAVGAYLMLGRNDPGGALVTHQEPSWQPRPPLTPEELAKLPNPLDGRKRADIPPDLLALAGRGDPDKAPAELVAVLGNRTPFTFPRWCASHEPAVSPDGKWLAAACDNTVAVFDAAGKLRRTLTGATKRFHHVVFSHDGKRVGVGCEDGKAYVWERESGKLELTLEHPGVVHGIAFSPDAKRIATCCADGSGFLWDADGQNKTALPKQPYQLGDVTFSTDSKALAFAGNGGVVLLWDVTAGKALRPLKGHTTGICHLRYSPDGKTLASGGHRETILWDLQTGKPRHLAACASGLLAFTSDGKTLLAARCGEERAGGHLLTRWDVVTGKKAADVPIGPRRKGVADLRYYAANSDGTIVYACNWAGEDRVSVIDAVTGNERFPADFHAGRVWVVAVSPDGKTLATGGEDRTVRLWDLAAWKPGAVLPPCRILEGHANAVFPLAFSPDGKTLASGDSGGVVILWDPATGKKLRDPVGKVGSNISSFAFSPDGKTLACPQQDGSVILFDTGVAGSKSWRFHKARARGAAFSPDGTLVASGGDDGMISVVDRASGKQLHALSGEQEVLNVAFSPDGKTLAATTAGVGELLTWDLADVTKTTALRGHTFHVQGLSLHPAGRMAATGSWDRTVRVWDLPTGRSRVFDTVRGEDGRVDSVAFTPEGRYLVAGSNTGTVHIWKTPKFSPEQGPPRKKPIDMR